MLEIGETQEALYVFNYFWCFPVKNRVNFSWVYLNTVLRDKKS